MFGIKGNVKNLSKHAGKLEVFLTVYECDANAYAP